MTREKLKIVPGVPFICTLETNDGKPMTSRFHDGVEYLYSVNYRGAPSLLYLPVEGAQALQRLGAKAGDEIQILKQQAQGQAPAFSARFVSDATLAVPAFAPDPNRTTAARQSDRFDQHMQQQPPAQASGVRMLAPQTAMHAVGDAVGAAYNKGATAYAPQPSNEAPSPATTMLAQCLMQAVDAAIGAERYAQSKGRELIFLSDDIRSMALTLVIGKEREGR